MKIQFDKPIPIEEAREKFNDCVKFITTTETYPSITGIEFQCEINKIFKRKAIEPKVTKKANQIIDKYSKKITRVWNKTFKEIKASAGKVKKADDSKEPLEDLRASLKTEAKKRFEESFKLGKLRGQIISKQEIDADDLTDDELAIIEERLGNNNKYLDGFVDELDSKVSSILEGDYESGDDRDEALDEVKDSNKSRALMYALAILGAVAAGTVYAISQADESRGEFRPRGGIWTLHPDEGAGGEVCQGCAENAGQFFTLAEFDEEYHTNDCLTNCRCDLNFEGQ